MNKSLQHKILACLFLAVITFAVYWQVSGHQFVNYDDGVYITENPDVRAGLTWDGMVRAFTTTRAGNWHPLTWLSHMSDVQLFGLDPGAHHLVNVLFHALNTILLYLLLLRITGAQWQSLFVASLFSLHPLHVESIAWAAERKDVLSAFFWIVTLMLYTRYVERPARMRYLLTLFAFILGLMSKPMLVTLPLVLLLMDYWPLGRLRLGQTDPFVQQGPGVTERNSSHMRLILEKVPFLSMSVIFSVITVYAQHKGGAVSSIESVSFSFRVINALWSYVLYVGKTLWPRDLAVIYPLPQTLTVLQGLSAALLLAGISALTLRSAKRHPYFITGWLWYLITLVPVIGLVQVGRQSMADRYTYIPHIGLFIMAAWGLRIIAKDNRRRQAALSAAAGLVLLVLAALTWTQSGHWKNSLTLFTHAVEAVAGNYVAHESLGHALAQDGRPEEAVYHYAEALRISPDYERALTGMGNVLVKQGKIKEAIEYTNRALLLKPDSPEAHFNMGFALIKQGKDNEAIYHYIEGLRGDPENAEIHFILGVTLGMQGKYDESIRHLSKALSITPDFAEGHYSLGVALLRQGKFDDGIMHFSEALRLKPDFTEARISLEEAVQLKD